MRKFMFVDKKVIGDISMSNKKSQINNCLMNIAPYVMTEPSILHSNSGRAPISTIVGSSTDSS